MGHEKTLPHVRPTVGEPTRALKWRTVQGFCLASSVANKGPWFLSAGDGQKSGTVVSSPHLLLSPSQLILSLGHLTLSNKKIIVRKTIKPSKREDNTSAEKNLVLILTS